MFELLHTFSNTCPPSAQLGGEIQAVEVVMKALTSRPSLTPDSTVTLLTPLLDQRTFSLLVVCSCSMYICACESVYGVYVSM